MPRPAAVVRAVLLGAVVFVVAAFAGVLLSSAAPADTFDPPPRGAASPAPSPAPSPVPTAPGTGTAAGQTYRPATAVDPDFARSMVYSGTAALALSVIGLVMVGRRRRCW